MQLLPMRKAEAGALFLERAELQSYHMQVRVIQCLAVLEAGSFAVVRRNGEDLTAGGFI